MVRVHEPVPPRRDATGLELVGRARDGRYQYRSRSVLEAPNVVNLTQDERVGLAVVRALLVAEWGDYGVYPMTREKGAQGYGVRGVRRQWMTRPQFAAIGRAFAAGDDPLANFNALFDTVAHECGHNHQRGGAPHGAEFQAAYSRARVRLRRRLGRGWPRIDRRSLREFKTKAARAAARKAAARSSTPEQRWRVKLTHAERMRTRYEAEAARAARLAEKWAKAERHARSWLGRVS